VTTRAIGTIVLVVVAIAVFSGCGNQKSDDSGSPAAEASDATGGNVDGRSRYFVNQIRHCMSAVNLLGQILQGGLDDIQIATSVSQARSICDASRDKMALADTTHFADQALDAEVALDEFRDGLKDVSDYVDTLAPSKAANGAEHFRTGRAWMATALDGINNRRSIYGAAPLG
jgi:hypothetical protein